MARRRSARPPGPRSGERNQQLWLHRADIWSGLVLGGALATRAFQPSLMPRRTSHQALVAGASGALGFGVAEAVYGSVARTGSSPVDLAALAVVGGTGFALSRLPDETDAFERSDGSEGSEEHDEASWRPLARTFGSAVAAGSVAASAGVAVRSVRRGRRPVAGGVLTAAATLTGARAVYLGLAAQRDAHQDLDPPTPRPLPAVGQSAGIAAVLTGLVIGFRHTVRGSERMLARRLGVPPVPARWGGRAAAVLAWFGTGKFLADTFVGGLRLYDRVVDPGFDRPPLSAARSAGPGSPLPFARLGREGRRFVCNVPGADDIEAVTGAPPVAEPVRVYVGYACARTDDERVTLALDELRRTGAFDRGLLVVGCPAGNGLVNTVPLETLDLVRRGDTAAVAVQYGRLPSFLTLRRTSRGGRMQKALLEAISGEVAARPPDQRPRVVVYGESLGAWAGQDTFADRGVAGLDELGVDRALWVGTPAYSKWRRQVVEKRTVEVPPGSVREIEGPADLVALGPAERDALRVVVLGHGNDPVRYLEASLLVRRPDWLRGERPHRVPPSMGWLPGVTAFQVIVDGVNATRPVPGVFRATGHEYNLSLPEVTLAAYGVDRPEPEVWERVVAHLQTADAERASHRHLPRAESDRPARPARSPQRRRAGRASR